MLSDYITDEQFGFKKNGHMHKVVGETQENLHSIKTGGLNAFILKINLAKAFDKVSWTFLQLILLHIGFSYHSTKWIMSCITTNQIDILINGAGIDFFSLTRGLRQHCQLSPPFIIDIC